MNEGELMFLLGVVMATAGILSMVLTDYIPAGLVICILGVAPLYYGNELDKSIDAEVAAEAPALAPPSFEVQMSYPCMDGGMPWDDNGRASCLTREQAEERAAKVAEALEKSGGTGKLVERLCANSLTMHICIEITPLEIIE